MDDLISRQAVLDAFWKLNVELRPNAIDAILNMVNDMPSVTLTQKKHDRPTGWIPVSERLPEESTAVLIWCPERKNIYCAYLEEKQWWIFGAYYLKVTIEVIAWMPLPQPYEPQERSDEE